MSSSLHNSGPQDSNPSKDTLISTSYSRQGSNLSSNRNAIQYNEKLSSHFLTKSAVALPKEQTFSRVEEDEMLDLLSSPIDNKTVLQFYKKK